MAEAAAIISGFKLLAPLAIDLLKKGYSYLGLDVDVDEKLHDLQNIIVPQIEMAIEAAENNPHKDRLRGWLKSMEEAVYEAEDELDLQDYYLLEQKVKSSAGGITVRLESLLPIKYLSKKFNIKLKKSLEKLEKTAMKAKEFLPFLSAGGSNVRRSQTTNESRRRVTTSRLPHEVVVFGRNKERDNIVDLLHETTAGHKPSVVAIVGVGGAGKTTLAQYICKHEREADPKYLDVTMWVHVSQIFDVEKLTRKMVESASGKDCPNSTNLDVLQSTLEDSIRSKKFLLVLDDVWIEKENVEMELEKLLAPLSAGKRGSKILMTTREKGVADALRARNIVPLEELKEDDFFAMFWHYAVGDTKNDDDKLCKELENIMRKNKLKLHGSPLAARVVGSRLRKIRDVDKWKRILSGDLLKDTMKSLLWSYQNLDAPLQRCFSYCSLFLKGDNIEREKLIHLWIAEGFIKPTDESKTIEDVGQDYFDDLLSSSFFQPTKDDGRYSIHDLLHDLAETVSKDRCLRVEGNLTNTIPQEIQHLSLHHINTLSDLVEKICNLKNLRTLIFFMWTFDDHILHSIFVKLKKLRVVHLKIRGLQNIPESIGGLKHLRYLYVDELNRINLPKSIYTLYHLEFLHIPNSGACTLEAKALANWINLQHLYFNSMIVNVVEINCWQQLWNQRKFHGRSIDIEGLENVKENREVTMDMDIETLHLEWSTTDNNSRSLDMDVQVLEGFHLTPKLDDLTIVGYRGCVLPSWMVGDHRYFLPNLKFLKLYRCRRVKQLPILPPTLTQLELHDCSSLPIVSKKDLAIIKSDVRISQVVTFMEGFDATYGGSHIIASELPSKLPWDEGHGYDSQKVHNWLEKTMGIVYQNPQEEEEAQLVLPSSLESLHIKSCPLTDSTLREGLSGLTFLVELEINNIVSLTSLPSADVMECLTVLNYLSIGSCWFLTSLGGLQALRSLTDLFISFCPNLSAEGGNTSVLPSSLQELEIVACHWKNLDDSQPDLTSSIDSESSGNIPFTASLQLGHLKLLRKLSIANCPNIGLLLGLQELNILKLLTLIGCPKLIHAETKLGSLEYGFNTNAPLLLSILLEEEVIVSLPVLFITKFKKESFRSEEERVFQHLTSLKDLCFENCSIKSLPNNLETLSTLTSLYIHECPNIKSLPNNLETLSTLTSLYIYKCPNIKSVPDLPRSLQSLSLNNCSIKSLPNNLETLSTLTTLDIDECPNIKSLPDLPRSLKTLYFKKCSIKSLPNNLETLSTLTRLDIYECSNIKSLPDLPRSLTRINLTNCNPVLERRCQKPHGEDWPKIAHIPDVLIYLPEYGGCFPWLVEIWGCMEWLSSLFH